jgi:penicillin-binding protein 1A
MGGIASLLVGGGLAWFLFLDIPDIHSVDDYRPQVATIVLDRTGKPVDAIYKQYRIITPLRKMPSLLPKAFVAAEDSRFWQHPGLDLWSILRAGINNVRSGRRSQGGSTITQQVTRSLMLTREKSYTRKITESILAYRLTKMLTKEEILYIYLNEIYLGAGAYGIEAGANRYFGKKSSQLSLAEIALLAGLPQAPSRYSPHKRPKAAKARQRYVLNRMAEEGLITNAAARKAYQQELHYIAPHKNKIIAGYFTAHVRKLLAKQYGQEALFQQGLTVMTTLDSQLQAHAVRAVKNGVNQVAKRQKTKNLPQGALVAMDARTGRVRALVGGTNYQQSQYNRAVDANRQPGSSFKPFIYAAAFEKGRQPGDLINDAPFSIRNRDGSVWQPKNYNNRYQGSTSLADGLIHSNNIVSIKLLQQAGLKPVIQLAQQAGISADLQPDLTLALGSSPVSLLEMTAGYAAFANQGLAIRPVFITSVRDHAGKLRQWPQPRPNKILSPGTAQQIKRLLTLAVQNGTGRQAAAVKNAAGKTGTSNNNTDAWFIGFSDRLLAGVWLGYDRSRSLGKKETGGRAAAPVWKTFMQQTKK